jgi:hypothetical protein
MKVFLDIDIGDAAKYEQESAAYQRALDFMQQCGSQYGLSGSLADLDDEGVQMLREAYSSDPNWSSKGGLSYCRFCCRASTAAAAVCCCCRVMEGCVVSSSSSLYVLIGVCEGCAFEHYASPASAAAVQANA